MSLLFDLFVGPVCFKVESSPPDVEIENHHTNITVELHTRFELNCTIRSIGTRGTVEWKHNNKVINGYLSGIIKNSYDREMCGYRSRVIMHNFTIANEGYYTCNATHQNPIVVKVLSTVILFMHSLILFHQQVNNMCIYELPNLYTRLSSLDIEPVSQIAN